METEPLHQEQLSNADTEQRFIKLRQISTAIGRTLAIGAGVWIGVNTGGSTTIQSGALQFEADAQIASPFDSEAMAGYTELSVPPLGSVELDTHDAPLKVSISPSAVNTEELEQIGNNPEEELQNFRSDLQQDIEAAKDDLLRKKLLQAGIGGSISLLCLYGYDQHRREMPKKETLKKLFAPLAIAGIAGTSFGMIGYHSAKNSEYSIQHATYTGLLASSPEVIGNFYDSAERFDEQTRQFADMISYLGQLANGYEDLLVIPNGVTNVLFVSDIHSQPGTFRLLDRTVQQFNVDMVIDAGDVTDHGATFENRFFQNIESLKVPYIISPGNHDSDKTLSSLLGMGNVTILNGESIEVEGLHIIGNRDPRFTPDRSQPRNDDVLLTRQSEQLAESIQNSEPDINIAVVHDPDAATDLYGLVPYILSGHVHHQNQQTIDNTLHIGSGSTGGAGLRAFETSEVGTPRTAMVLAFDDDNNQLVRVTKLDFGSIGQNRTSIEVCDVVNQEIKC